MADAKRSPAVGRSSPRWQAVVSLLSRGVSALRRGQVERSRQLCEQAVQACPQNAEARGHLAEALWQQGRKVDAIYHLEFAHRHAPDDPALSIRLGEMYLEAGQLSRAESRANDVLDQMPEYANAWALRGSVNYHRGEMQRALSDSLRALGYQPNDQRVMTLVTHIHLQTNRPRRALSVVRGLVETYPHDEQPGGVDDLEGQVLVQMGRFGDAVECFASAARRGKANPGLLCRLGQAQLQAGQLAAATATVREALALDANSRPALELAGRLQKFPQTASRTTDQPRRR